MTRWWEAVGENPLGSMAGIVSLWIGWLIRNEMSSFFLAGELSKCLPACGYIIDQMFEGELVVSQDGTKSLKKDPLENS